MIESMKNEDVYNDNIENIKLMDSPKSDNIKNLLILLTILLIILTISIFITKFILSDSKKVAISPIDKNVILEDLNINEENIDVENNFMNVKSIIKNREEEIQNEVVTTIIDKNHINNSQAKETIFSKNNFYIKIASLYEKPSSAYLSKIKRAGFNYKLVFVEKSNKTLIRILIGPFLSKKSANNNLNFIQKRFNKSAYITKL